jgi:proteasome-associated ATPase
MSAEKNKGSAKPRQKITSSRKQLVDTIVKEAEESRLPGNYEKNEGVEEIIKKSEGKRLMLAEALHASREQMRRITPFQEDEKDRAFPFGVFVRYGKDKKTAIIRHHGRLYEAKILMDEDEEEPKPTRGTFHALHQKREKRKSIRREFMKGELLLLNNDLQVLEPRGFDLVSGSLGTVQQILNDEKLLVKTVGDESIVMTRAHPLMNIKILAGDNIEYDTDSLFTYNLLPKSAVDRLVLEKVPDISYDDIGGLANAIELIRDAIELPHLYPEYFKEHRLLPPKGILFYGPPGCGKTLLAKAVANSLAKRIEEKTGEKGESFFLNVKGPELLNKYVGETEQAIRDLFARARNQASYRTPVIIFFDEMDSMFRTRGSGVSSDMEATIVPQFLAELDGLEALENVVVIGATNREDLIDPGVLRPGRLDRKIRIPRPGKRAAMDIFSKYLIPELPLESSLLESSGGPDEAVEWMKREVVEEMYNPKPENEFLEITYADGNRKILYLKDFTSGAIIENIVNRAKLSAVKDLIKKGKKGINLEHLLDALRQEYKENEDLPSNTNPAEWYRIIGKGGERVIRMRSLLGRALAEAERKKRPKEMVEVGEGLK